MKNTLVICFFILGWCTAAQDAPRSLVTSEKDASTKKIVAFQALAQSYIERPGEDDKDLDSALIFIHKAVTLNKRVRSVEAEGLCHVLYSKVHREAGNSEKGRKHLEKALQLGQGTRYYMLLGEAWSEKCHYYPPGNNGDKILALSASAEAYSRLRASRQYGAVLSLLSEYYLIEQRYAHAIDAGEKALQVYQKAGENDLMVVYHVLSSAFGGLHNYEQSIRYGLKAFELAEQRPDNAAWLSIICSDLGWSYAQVYHHTEALTFYYKALEAYKQMGKVASIHNVALSLLAHGQFPSEKEARSFYRYVCQKYPASDPESLIAYHRTMVLLSLMNDDQAEGKVHCAELAGIINKNRRIVHPYNQNAAYSTIINYAVNSGDSKVARKYYDLYAGLPGLDGVDTLTLAGYKHQIDFLEGNYRIAISGLQRSDKLFTRLTQSSKSKLFSEMMVQFDIQKKDNAITEKKSRILLLEKQKQLKDAQLGRRYLLNVVILSLTVLLVVLVIVVCRGYFMRQRAGRDLLAKKWQIEQKNIQLTRLVEERQWLVSEIHERVKNNLQIIKSLLISQSDALHHTEAKSAILNSQHRVQSMALIHSKLYLDGSNPETIPIKTYIEELAHYLHECFSNEQVTFHIDVEDLPMDVSFAVPIGLIINEAVTNSLKYAFPDRRRGLITILLTRTQQDTFCLRITDNGIGYPDDLDITRSKSLGIRLIRGLSRDMEGSFSMLNSSGTVICIEFTYKFNLKQKQSRYEEKGFDRRRSVH